MSSFISKGKRIKLHISNAEVKRIGDHKIQTLKATCNLSDPTDTLAGMAEFIQNAYTLMQKTSNKSKSHKFDEVLDGMAIDVFPTPKGRRVFATITDSTISNFSMARTGKDDETAMVTLSFELEFTGRKEIYDWAWDHKGASCFASFEQQQRELTMEAPNGSGVDDEDEDEDEDVDDDEGDFEDDDE